MELSIASNGHQGLPVHEKQNCHKGGKFPFKAENKQSLIITTAPFKVPFKCKMKEEKSMHAQDKGKRKLKLQEMQNTQYPFSNSDVSEMFDHLISLELIELPKMKRPEEANQTNDPKYCKYHRLISHPIKQCFVLKDKIIELAHQGKIIFDDEIMTSNLSMVTLKTVSAFPTIQFGSFETTKRKALSSSMVTPKISYDDTHRDIHLHEDESSVTNREEWTLMAR